MARQANDLDIPVRKPKAGVLRWLRGRFFAGIVIAAPIVVTFLAIRWFIAVIDNTVTPLLPPLLKPETYTNYAIPGFGVLVAVILLTVVGAIATNLIGRSVIGAADRLLQGVPVVRNVYSLFKQLTDVLATNNTDRFDEVVLVEYPKKGSWCIGFVSSPAREEVARRLAPDFIGVFVPTTPNPTSGFLIYVDPQEVRRLDMSVEDGAKMILSAGLVVPVDPQRLPPGAPVPVTVKGSPSSAADVAGLKPPAAAPTAPRDREAG